MHAQSGAEDTQILAAGLATLESSSVPARTKIRCGRASDSLNICVPQTGQKRRCMTLPLSAMLLWSRNSPLMVMALLGKHTFTVALPAAQYWQSRHQHMRVMMGSAVMTYLTAPHKHPPMMG